VFEVSKLENDTLFDFKQTYDIKKQGLYSIYIAFCSADKEYNPYSTVEENILLRIIESNI
jgi:hypothetical protein